MNVAPAMLKKLVLAPSRTSKTHVAPANDATVMVSLAKSIRVVKGAVNVTQRSAFTAGSWGTW